MINHTLILLALRGQLATVSGLPTDIAYVNRALTTAPGDQYLEEDFQPDPPTRVTLAKNGVLEARGLYAIRVFSAENEDAAAILTLADAIVAKLSAGTKLVLSDGNVVEIRGDPAPGVGPVLPGPPGFCYTVVRVWWRVATRNQAAA